MARNFGIGKHTVNVKAPTPGIKRNEGNTDLADGRSGSSPFQRSFKDGIKEVGRGFKQIGQTLTLKGERVKRKKAVDSGKKTSVMGKVKAAGKALKAGLDAKSTSRATNVISTVSRKYKSEKAKSRKAKAESYKKSSPVKGFKVKFNCKIEKIR